MSQKKFIIDADTGSDDAVAILMALRDSRVDVLGVTVVSGNVPLKQGIINSWRWLWFKFLTCSAMYKLRNGCSSSSAKY